MIKPKKLVPAALPASDAPAPFDIADASAVQALLSGTAEPEQQQRALKWVIEAASATYLPGFRSGEEGRRSTDFMLGRIFVGQQIIGLLKVNISKLRRDANAAAG